ncbi:MAG TPA: hypothetical protein VMR25_00335 [Planctomycetaceae bacterium]|jgi:hypothetical protein|nr:hypothetical protein [Planctomycetaceae bacterium]
MHDAKGTGAYSIASSQISDSLHSAGRICACPPLLTGEPVVLTVNGKAQVVVQDAAAYQKLLDAAAKTEREETVAAIREGLAEVKGGRTKPAKAALKALAKKYGIATPDK